MLIEQVGASPQIQPVGSVTLEEQLMVKLEIPLEQDQFGQKVFSVQFMIGVLHLRMDQSPLTASSD